MKDIVTSYIAFGVITLANLIGGVLTARLLLPAGRGELGQVIFWPSLFAALGTCAISEAVIYFTARKGEPADMVIAAALTLAALLSALLVAAGWIATPYLHQGSPPELTGTAYILLLYIPLNLSTTYIVAWFQGQLRFGAWNILRVLPACSYAVLVAVIGVTGLVSVRSIAIANLASIATVALGALALAPRPFRLSWPNFGLMKGLLGFGLGFHFGDLLLLANQRLDQLVIVRWLPAADYGHYLIALTFASMSYGVVFLPGQLLFAKAAATTDRDAQAVMLGRYLRVATALALLATLLLMLLAPWLVALLYGASYAASAPLLRALAFMVPPMVFKTVLNQSVKAARLPKVLIQAELIGLAAMVVSLAALLPPFGVMGAALALVAAQLAACIALALAARGPLGIRLAANLALTAGDVRFIALRLRELLGTRKAA